MAYGDPWDLSTPTSTEILKNGDDRIREMKRALDQRLGTVMVGWPNTDPLLLLGSAVSGTVPTATTAANALKAQTVTGTTGAVANGVSTDMFTITDGADSVWLVTVRDTGVGAGLELNASIVTFNDSNNTVGLFQLSNPASNIAINYTGFTIRFINNTGATKSFIWTAIRLY